MLTRILVVEDSNLMLQHLVQVLRNSGFQVVGRARDGDEAVRLYGELRPDVVTLDVTMRGKDGLTAAREIQEMDPDARIVIYTLSEPTSLNLEDKNVRVKGVIKKGDEEALIEALKGLT